MEGNKTEPNYFDEIKKRYKASTLNIVLLTRSQGNTLSAPKHVIEQLRCYKQQNRINKQMNSGLLLIKTDGQSSN